MEDLKVTDGRGYFVDNSIVKKFTQTCGRFGVQIWVRFAMRMAIWKMCGTEVSEMASEEANMLAR